MSAIENRIRLVQGDITSVEADAIVTAANVALCGGGGVDGAVHDAAGPELLAASMALAPCPAGSCRITKGFNLSARHIVHAVGPVFNNLDSDSLVLASAYQSALSLAFENRISTIVFPCISTGAFGFPSGPACDIAISTVVKWLQANDSPEYVTFCCFESRDFAQYQANLAKLGFNV